MVQRLANAISEWCEETSGTLEQLSAISNVPIQTLKRLKKGETDNPYTSTVVDLARAMNLSLDELFGLKPSVPDPVSQLPPNVPDSVDTITSLTLVRDILTRTVDYLKSVIREKDLAHERHIRDLAAAHAKHTRTLRIAVWAISAFAVLEFAFIIGVYIYDLTHPDRGFFQLEEVQALMNSTKTLLPFSLPATLLCASVRK